MHRHHAKLVRATFESLIIAAFVACVGIVLPAFAYDTSWYKMNGWIGEYPNGFTVAKDVTINIRETLDLNAPKSASCLLKRGATYHPWNQKRVASDQLEFVSFSKIVPYEVTANLTTQLIRKSDEVKTIIKFVKGDRWSFLSYLAEGTFLIKFGNSLYVADQNLIASSTEIGTSNTNTQDDYAEWMKLKCANGNAGWIFLSEIANSPAFTTPKLGDYDTAIDDPSILIPMKRVGSSYVVPVLINNALTLDFILDSGASDVTIPADVVLTLVRTGTLNKADFIGHETYRLADGRVEVRLHGSFFRDR